MDIRQYEQYLVYDEPIPYKDILIYPVTVKNYMNFYMAVNCLTIEKNKIPDPKIISMSYLDYLFYLIDNDDENGSYFLFMLIEIFRICLHIEHKDIRYFKNNNGKINLVLNYTLENSNTNNKEIIIDKTYFDEIKKIILYQNIPDYDETYIDPNVEQALKEAQEFVNKHKKKTASFEDQMVCVMLALQELDKEKIYNLTLRKFAKIIQRYDYKLHYEIYKTAECSGMVSFKQEIDHWMCDLSNSNKYSDVIVDYGQFKNKMQSVT